MKKTRKKSSKIKIANNYAGMLAIAAVVLVLLAALMIQSRSLTNRLMVYDTRAAALEEQIEEEQARTEEIDDLKDYMQTDEYAEEVARNRLGLVKDNEIVFQEQN